MVIKRGYISGLNWVYRDYIRVILGLSIRVILLGVSRDKGNIVPR